MNVNGEVSLTGSNVEQTLGSAIPSKAVLMGISDGTNIRAMTGNLKGTLLASAARTATTSSPNQTNYNAEGVYVYLNITAASGTGGLSLLIRSVDPVSGGFVTHAAATAPITATGCYGYELNPGSSTAGSAGASGTNLRVAGALPATWFVQVTHGDASSYTYSVGNSLNL